MESQFWLAFFIEKEEMTFEEKVWRYVKAHPPVVKDPSDSYVFINIRSIERFTTINGDYVYYAMIKVAREKDKDSSKPTIITFILIENDKGEVFEGPSIHVCLEWNPPQEATL